MPITEETAERDFLTKLDPDELATYLTKKEAAMAATGEGITLSSEAHVPSPAPADAHPLARPDPLHAMRLARLERQASNDETGRLRKVSLAVEYMYAGIYHGHEHDAPAAGHEAIAEASTESSPARELPASADALEAPAPVAEAQV